MSTESIINEVTSLASDINTIRDNLDKDRNIPETEAHTSTSFINSLNAHIGSSGSEAHHIATLSNKLSGFMSSSDYATYLTIPTKIAELEALINSYKVPEGCCCWYYGDPDDLPSDWELVSDNTSSSYYEGTQDPDGVTFNNVREITGAIGGNPEEIECAKSSDTKIKTIALYLIRKKKDES